MALSDFAPQHGGAKAAVRPTTALVLDHLASDEVLNAAFAWVCKQRTGYSPNSDIWEVRRQWTQLKPRQDLYRPDQRWIRFLGYAFSPEGLGVAARSIGQLAAHVIRLYEQGADLNHIGDYVQRWRQRWQGCLNIGPARSADTSRRANSLPA